MKESVSYTIFELNVCSNILTRLCLKVCFEYILINVL